MKETKLGWVLRIGAAACFVGHGAFGIITKAAWLPFFALMGIGPEMAYQLMPIIGAVDIAVGLSVLLSPRPAALAYMTVWALWTAALRPLTGDHVWEMLERAGNYGIPAAYLAVVAWPTSLRGWFRRADAVVMTPDLHARISKILVITVAVLLAGHGMLSVLQKPLLVSHYALIAPPSVAASTSVMAGVFELVLALAIVVRPIPAIAAFIAGWKIATESLFIFAGAPAWEFVERAGSYAAPLGIVVLAAFAPVAASLRWSAIRFSRTVVMVVAALLSTAASLEAQGTADDSLLKRLRLGGLAVACRHAITDHANEDRMPVDYADRSAQRNLSAAGEAQARTLGGDIRAAGIPVGDVFANPFFRTKETATLAFGKVVVIDSLGASGVLKRHLEQVVPTGTNRFFSTRNGMLSNAFRGLGLGAFNEGDCVVVEPSGSAFTVVRKLSPDDWARLAGRNP